MEVFTVANQKGGTGKTATAAAIAQAGAYHGKKVLAIDLDPQANFSFAIGAEVTPENGTSYDLLEGKPPEEIAQATDQGIDIIPASLDLSAIQTGTGSARRLQTAIEPIKKYYDLIIIDTPPTPGELLYNALQASTGLIIPVQADIYNLSGFHTMTETARLIQKSNPALTIRGALVTLYDGRSNLARQTLDAIRRQAEAAGVPFLGTIRAGVTVKEAAALQQSLFEYAPKSKPAQDYLALYEHITQEV